MNTTEAKVALLQYCRFARQMPYVATEVNIYENIADVAASDGKNFVEYEIKISLQDLLKDSEKHKHIVYDPTPITWNGDIGTKGKLKFELRQGLKTWQPDKWSAFLVSEEGEYNLTGWREHDTMSAAMEQVESEYGSKKSTPNTLYYVIPTWLWEKHQEKIEKSLHPNYGVITGNSHNYHGLTVVKKAKKLHKNPIDENSLGTIVRRMSSELATLTNMYYIQNKEFTDLGKRVDAKFDLETEDE